MRIRVLTGRVFASAVLAVALALGSEASDPVQGLNVGTVTAKIDGVAFSTSVSIAAADSKRLVISNLGNTVQIQVPGAAVKTFEIKLGEDGEVLGANILLKTGKKRIVTPVSGSLVIEVLDGKTASGRFAFDGKDVATDAPVKVTEGRFQVHLTRP